LPRRLCSSIRTMPLLSQRRRGSLAPGVHVSGGCEGPLGGGGRSHGLSCSALAERSATESKPPQADSSLGISVAVDNAAGVHATVAVEGPVALSTSRHWLGTPGRQSLACNQHQSVVQQHAAVWWVPGVSCCHAGKGPGCRIEQPAWLRMAGCGPTPKCRVVQSLQPTLCRDWQYDYFHGPTTRRVAEQRTWG